ncbi:hypothetical protein BJX65DRAFT_6329 [Aspergillus insuetus]
MAIESAITDCHARPKGSRQTALAQPDVAESGRCLSHPEHSHFAPTPELDTQD